MPTFQPPTDNWHGLTDFDVDEPQTPNTRLARRLFSHYAPLPRGRNIYKLSNGTYIEDDPYDIEDVVKTYYGGHIYDITAEEAADLTAAGYGAYIV